jgi:hypothetical protein
MVMKYIPAEQASVFNVMRVDPYDGDVMIALPLISRKVTVVLLVLNSLPNNIFTLS